MTNAATPPELTAPQLPQQEIDSGKTMAIARRLPLGARRGHRVGSTPLLAQ